MTRVLVTSIGNSPAIDIARSLRRDSSLYLIGGDAGEWGHRIGKQLCNEMISLPRADVDPAAYAEALQEATRTVDFAFVGLDIEIEGLVRSGKAPACPTALPPLSVCKIFLDKTATAVAADRPEDFPATAVVVQPEDVNRAFATIAPPLWLRPSAGTSGRGSLKAESAEEALFWISYWRRRGVEGAWIAQEYLPGRNMNWTALYSKGRLITAASMERLQYFLGDIAVSGITGQIKLCATIDHPTLPDVADRVVRSIDAEPNGLYSVDVREDANGHPRVNEINPRPAGRPWLYTNAGVNLPLAALRSLRGEEIGDALDPRGFRIGLRMYRQLDIEPTIAD